MLERGELLIVFGVSIAFFFQSMMMLGIARRLRRAEATIKWLKSCQQSHGSRIADLSEDIESMEEEIELAQASEKPKQTVVMYDESIDQWSTPRQ